MHSHAHFTFAPNRRQVLTASGAKYYVGGVGMAHNEYNPHDIAHALAQINRFNGHAKRPYSVAEHSLVCMEIAQHLELPPVVQLACLMQRGGSDLMVQGFLRGRPMAPDECTRWLTDAALQDCRA